MCRNTTLHTYVQKLFGKETCEAQLVIISISNILHQPPRNWKNCCRNLVLSSRDIYFQKEGRTARNSQETILKKSIFHRDFDQKQLKIFFIFGGNANVCTRVSLFSLPDGNPSSNTDDLSIFYKFQSFFSVNFKNYHPISNSPLSKPF